MTMDLAKQNFDFQKSLKLGKNITFFENMISDI